MTTPHQPDLLATIDPLALFSGRLLRHAEARTKVLDHEGHAVPVLCMDIESDSPTRGQIHVERPYPFGHQAEAEAEARRLKAGTHVTVEAPLTGLRLVIPNAVHVRAADSHPTPSTRKDIA